MTSKRPYPAVLLAMALCACATVPRVEAAGDIHAFLVSIRDGDRAGFDAHVDRDALKENLRARVLAYAGRSASSEGGAAAQALGAFLAGPLLDAAVDAFLRPEVFRAIAEDRGYRPNRPLPSSLAIAQFVKTTGGDGACVVLKKDGPCVLDFKDEAGVWKLTGFEGDLSMLRPGR